MHTWSLTSKYNYYKAHGAFEGLLWNIVTLIVLYVFLLGGGLIWAISHEAVATQELAKKESSNEIEFDLYYFIDVKQVQFYRRRGFDYSNIEVNGERIDKIKAPNMIKVYNFEFNVSFFDPYWSQRAIFVNLENSLPSNLFKGTGVYLDMANVVSILIFFSLIAAIANLLYIVITRLVSFRKGGVLYANLAGDREKVLRERTMTYIANNINHELSSPLSVIASKIRKLKRSICSEGKKNGNGAICRVCDGGLQAVFDSIDVNIASIDAVLNKTQEIKIKRQNLTTLADFLQEGYLTASQNRVDMQEATFDVDHNLHSFELDETAGLSVGAFINIITNHIKNSIEANSTSINIASEGFYQRTGLITIVVEDNGNGVPEHKKNHLFEYEVSTKGSGRGVGLFLNRQLLRDSGGDVRLVETSKNGTSFAITIKVKRKEA